MMLQRDETRSCARRVFSAALRRSNGAKPQFCSLELVA
jgi:hypothetical protein